MTTDEMKRDELVVRMVSAYHMRRLRDDWTKEKAMAASLQVAADALLPVMSSESRMEWEAAWKQDECSHDHFPGDKGYRTMLRMNAARRASLSPPRKTAEENAVEVVAMMIDAKHSATSIVSAVIAMLREKRP